MSEKNDALSRFQAGRGSAGLGSHAGLQRATDGVDRQPPASLLGGRWRSAWGEDAASARVL